MKKILIIILALINFVFMQDIGNEWSHEAKTIFYLSEKISPEVALYFQFTSVLPFMNLGYAYSDNWRRGAIFDGAMMGTILFAEIFDKKNECQWYDDDCIEDKSLSKIQSLVALGFYIFKFVDAYQQAEKYNDRLYNKVFGGQRPYFSMGYDTENKGSMLTLNFPIGK